MATSGYNSNTVSIQQLRTLFTDTESGNSANVFSFAGGSSTYSFGLLQFDVGNNGVASQFLLANGFTQSDISELSSNGGLSADQLAALDSKLQTIPASTLDQFTDDMLTQYQDFISNLVGNLLETNPQVGIDIENSQDLQLALIDYNNQYTLSGLDPASPYTAPANGMLAYLQGQSVNMASGQTLQLVSGTGNFSLEDIQNFINNTTEAVNQPSVVANRQQNLYNALDQIDNGQLVNNDTASLGSVSSLQATSAGLTGDISSSYSSDGTFNLQGYNGSVSISQDGYLNVVASNSSFNFLEGVSGSVQGSGNTLQCNASDDLNNQGNNNYYFINDGSINDAAGDSGLGVDGIDDIVTTNANDQLTAGGDTIDAASGDTLSLTDSGDVQNTIDGTNFTISQSNGSLAFNGSGTLNGSGNALEIDANSKGTVTSSNDAIDMDGGATLIDSAGDGNDTINASAGDTIQISNDGGSNYLDTINANGDAGITLDAGSSLDLVGSGNAVAANNGDQITATDNTIDANNASLTLT
ncbi:hypothetical protein ISP15_12155, partial [Dyella jejuensis]